MHFIPEALEDYVAQHSAAEPELLQQLNRETHQKVLQPRMLSGAYQGRLLALISKLLQPKAILEVGTFTGYATLCLAEGLATNGHIDTIDHNEELAILQNKYFNLSPWAEQIQSFLGDAADIIPALSHKYDLVFIDADKENYALYADLIIPKMNQGGLILSDNVLWSGKVIEAVNDKDVSTKALVDFNKKMNEDPRLETVLLPIRDGLTLSRVR
ncbi:MAG: methyltransferase [Flavobacterium sp. BFFFF2]|nr:MAG: methyltransferase [Flavobacterium sp. BFFFF2]